MLAESGYDFGGDGWLGIALGELLYYNATNRANLTSQLDAMIGKELDGKSSQDD